MLCDVVPISAGRSAAAATRRPTPDLTARTDLGQLVDGLQVLALTRPIALIVIKKLVIGLLSESTTGV
jgi:hypothetical protein